MTQTDSWRLKLEALLRPSPFRGTDHPREATRQKDVAEILALVDQKNGWQKNGRQMNGWPAEQRTHDALIERCMRDAYDTHVLPGFDTSAHVDGVIAWRHPLSAARSDGATADEWFQAESDRFAKIKEYIHEYDLKKAYFYIWHEVMQGTDAPGSLAFPDHGVSAHRSLTAALAGARAQGDEAALLYIHVGPVQGFIKASRRTHDLWTGSYTVMFLTFQAVCAIARELGPDAIIYPDLAHLDLAVPLLFSERDQQEPGRDDLRKRLRSSIANKFLAVVPHSRAEELARAAMKSVQGTWCSMARNARSKLDKGLEKLDNGVKGPKPWDKSDEQIEAHPEFDAVVQPWPGNRDALHSLLDGYDLEPPKWLDDHPERVGGGYGALFDLTHRVLSAHRKRLLPLPVPGDQRPKCTQCGEREQIGPILDKEKPDAETGRPETQMQKSRAFFTELSRNIHREDGESQRWSFQLARGEGLCAVCLTKRFATEVFYGDKGEGGAGLGLSWRVQKDRELLRFPGVVTIASAPFRYRLLEPQPVEKKQHDPAALRRELTAWVKELDELLARDCLDFTPPGNLLPGLPTQGAVPGLLEHDGDWFYDSNYDSLTAWRNNFPDDPDDDDDRLEKLKDLITPAYQAYRAVRKSVEVGPCGYYAVLQLDGDKMGQWLTGKHPRSPEIREIAVSSTATDKRPLYPALHRDLSRRLGVLAHCLYDIVEAHLGRVVYTGGDDLLAFLPLQTALSCMHVVERAIRAERHLGERVTISAGLSIAHMRMPLSRALEQARSAEDMAKRAGRNRFTVHLSKRSGAPLRFTLPWRVSDTAGESHEIIPMLLALIKPRPQQDNAGKDDKQPLLRVDIAYRLQQELDALATIPAAFGSRVKYLLGGRQNPVVQEAQPLFAMLDADPPCETLKPSVLVDLLLFLRFLLREEHGIHTHQLLHDLKVEECLDDRRAHS